MLEFSYSIVFHIYALLSNKVHFILALPPVVLEQFLQGNFDTWKYASSKSFSMTLDALVNSSPSFSKLAAGRTGRLRRETTT